MFINLPKILFKGYPQLLGIALGFQGGIIGHRNEIFSKLGEKITANREKQNPAKTKPRFFGVFVFCVILKV